MDCCINVLGVFLNKLNQGEKYVQLSEIESCLSKSKSDDFDYDNTPEEALKFLIRAKRVRKISKGIFAFNGNIFELRNYLLTLEKDKEFSLDNDNNRIRVKDTISLHKDIVGKVFRSSIGDTHKEIEDSYEASRSYTQKRRYALFDFLDDDDIDIGDEDCDDEDSDDDMEDLEFDFDVDIDTSVSNNGRKQTITEEQYKNMMEVESIVADRKDTAKDAIDIMFLAEKENKLLADLWTDLTCCGFKVKKRSDVSCITFKNDAEEFLLKIIMMQDTPTLEQTISMAIQMHEKTPVGSRQCIKELEEIIQALTTDSSSEMFRKIIDKIDT